RVSPHGAHQVGELARRCGCGRASVDENLAAQGAACEVRDEPVDAAQQRRLARAGATNHQAELAFGYVEVDIDQRRLGSVRVGEGHVIETDHGRSSGSGGVNNTGRPAISTQTTGNRGSDGTVSGLYAGRSAAPSTLAATTSTVSMTSPTTTLPHSGHRHGSGR